MSHSISTLLIRNLDDVFCEIDPTRRRAAIDEIFHEDAVYYDLNGAYRGRDEIHRIILSSGISQALRPEELGNGGRVRWVSGRPVHAPSFAGTDFIIAQDGRIAPVYRFVDKLP